jgi:hypothetical protein
VDRKAIKIWGPEAQQQNLININIYGCSRPGQRKQAKRIARRCFGRELATDAAYGRHTLRHAVLARIACPRAHRARQVRESNVGVAQSVRRSRVI